MRNIWITFPVSAVFAAGILSTLGACDQSAAASPQREPPAAAAVDENEPSAEPPAEKKEVAKKPAPEPEAKPAEPDVPEIDVDALLAAKNEASGVLSTEDLDGIDTSRAPVLGADVAKQTEQIQQAEWLALPGGQLEIPNPPGWMKKREGNVGVIASPDQKAAIIFTTVREDAEVAKALDEVGRAIGVTHVTWKEPMRVQFGQDHLPALVRGGEVTVASGEQGKVLFAIVDTGGPDKVLAVGVKDASASADVERVGQAVLLSIRRKR